MRFTVGVSATLPNKILLSLFPRAWVCQSPLSSATSEESNLKGKHSLEEGVSPRDREQAVRCLCNLAEGRLCLETEGGALEIKTGGGEG